MHGESRSDGIAVSGDPHVPAVAAAFVAMNADLAPRAEAAFVASAVDLELGRVVARLEYLDAAFCTHDDGLFFEAALREGDDTNALQRHDRCERSARR